MVRRIWKLIEDYGLVQGKLVALTAENSRLQASCDFLAARVTQLETERVILLERVLGLQLPAFQVSREEPKPEVPQPRMPPDLTPEALARLVPRVVPMPEGVAGTVYRGPTTTIDAEAQSANALFEDMGDERAAQLGVSHGDDGTVRYAS